MELAPPVQPGCLGSQLVLRSRPQQTQGWRGCDKKVPLTRHPASPPGLKSMALRPRPCSLPLQGAAGGGGEVQARWTAPSLPDWCAIRGRLRHPGCCDNPGLQRPWSGGDG